MKEIVNNVDQNKEEEEGEDSSSSSPSPQPPDVVMDTIVPNSSNKTPDVCHGGVDHAVRLVIYSKGDCVYGESVH